MADLQTQMDRGAKQLRRMIGEAIREADRLCAAGDADASADVWELAARLCSAHAKGRSLNVGGIRPMFGGKD